MASPDPPSEHTPLLANTTSPTLHPTDLGAALVPQPADPHIDPPIDHANGLDAEHGAIPNPDHDAPKQFEGMPEVRKHMVYIFPAVAIGVFLAAADQTVIVSSYGKIGSELDGLNKTSWIANAYFLTLTTFQPLYGKLSDIFGRKPCLVFSYSVFGLGCLWCGMARSIDELLLARAFAGIGGGGMTTIVSILFSDVIPLRERGTWQGYINLVFASGSAAGAPMGGIIADYISWRWAFLAQVPLCVLAVVSVSYFLHLPPRDEHHWRDKLHRIDFLGALTFLAAVASLLVGLDRGSNVSWTSPLALGPLIASIPLLAIFLYIEVCVAKEPFAPSHIILARPLWPAYLCNFFSFSGWLAAIFYIPLYLQAVLGKTATQASLLLIPAIIFGVSGSLFGGIYMQRTGKYYWLTVICYQTLTLGLIGITISTGGLITSVPLLVASMCVAAFSNGLGVTSSLIALIANAGQEDQAITTACSYLFRSLGCVFGVSISATAVNQVLRSALHEKLGDGPGADEIADAVRHTLETLKKLSPEVLEIVRGCYEKATTAAFGLEIAIVAGAALSAWFIREKPLIS